MSIESRTSAAHGSLAPRTNALDPLDILGLCALALALVLVWLLAPPWRDWQLLDPTTAAVVLGTASVSTVLLLRASGRRGSRLERWILAAFLAGMPVVYVAAWLGQPAGTLWLALELAGLVLFGALAYLGLRGSAWYLAVGILAHGIGWDAWHHGAASFIADWYTLFCGGADVCIATYVATQVRALAR